MPSDFTSLPTVAYLILQGFDKSYRLYLRITRGAQERFEQAQWQAAQQAIKDRINIYETSVNEVVEQLYQKLDLPHLSKQHWIELKYHYQSLLGHHPQSELAETFYNSVMGNLFRHNDFAESRMFILPTQCFLPGRDRDSIVNQFNPHGTVREFLESLFDTYRFNCQFENKERDIQYVEQALEKRLKRPLLAKVDKVEILKPVFYRSKAAYVVGRICSPNESVPFVISLTLNKSQHLYVEALLTERADLSALFSFSHSYFMADTDYPAEVVAFLHALLPNKKVFELFISLGFYKHGKTVFFRDYLKHLDNSEDQFDIAPGVKGLVMLVFDLPSYGVVFKIIKDEFGESKKISRDHVKYCYQLVKTTDRVGRMADTNEYINFRFPLERISDNLLAELKQEAASSITITENELIIRHLYIEKKLTPLNLYLQREQDEQKIAAVIDDLGLCIKQIAAANIFPGDMLHKNFGVTRLGRVIFYDYDEISLMTQPNFRDLPSSDDPYGMDTLSVAPGDVFPQQFEHFILGKKVYKDMLKAFHPELMQPDYWRQLQRQSAAGQVQDFTPFNQAHRFNKEEDSL